VKNKNTLLLTVFMIAWALALGATALAQDETLKVLNDTSVSLYEQGKYIEAAELAERALKSAENTFGPDNPQVAPFLNNLAVIYYAQGKYAEAEEQYERALRLTEPALGSSDHPRVKSMREGLEQCKQKLLEREVTEDSDEADEIAELPDASPPKEIEPVQAPTDANKLSHGSAATDRQHAEKLYTVQAGAFRNLLNAKGVQDRLEKNGYNVSITSVTVGNGETLHKVQVGEFNETKKAKMLAQEIRTLMGLDTFITTK
jgi:cell division septation protein DedD